MMRCYWFLATSLFLLATAAPASAEPTLHERVQRIVLVGPANPIEYRLNALDLGSVVLTSVGFVAGGAIGGVMVGLGTDRHPDPALSPEAQTTLRLGEELGDALAAALQSSGYLVTRSAFAREKADELLRDPAAVPGDEDAILDVAIETAMYEELLFGPIYPNVMVRVRLTERKSGATLYRENFRCSRWEHAALVAVDVQVDKQYSFPSSRAVLDDPAKAVAGFRACVPLLAGKIQAALAK
jgi:hypothetical protein